jgi:hypothetical protein
MEEKKEEDLKEKLELLNKILLVSSSLALIVGGLWFLLYSIFVVKDFPRVIDISLSYYIFAIFVFFIFLIVYPLAFYLYVEIEDDILDKKIQEKYGIGIKNKNFNSKDNSAKNNNNLLNKIKNLLNKIKILNKIKVLYEKKCKGTDNTDNNKIQNNRHSILKKIALFYLIISICVNFILFSYILLVEGYFIIFPISDLNLFGHKISVWLFLIAVALLFITFQLFLIFCFKHHLKGFLLDKDKKSLFFSITSILIVKTLFYAVFFLTAPFYILKLGYFEANLTIDKKYVEKSGLKTYLENYQPKCLNKSSNDNYCKFFITCSEKCQTECLDELFKDTQNDNHCRTFKFFIFLRTRSEYIVGCSENSNVRIHIPADKVIAIDYNDKTSTPQQNKQ